LARRAVDEEVKAVLPEIPAEQSRQVLDTVAREVLLEAGLEQPPVDAFHVAAQLGLIVARDRPAACGLAQPRARFVRLGASVKLSQTSPGDDGVANQGTILLADDPRLERRQWAVAHEIGESRAYRVFAELGVDPREAPPAAREAVANRLAGSLLLPRDWFIRDGVRVDWDLFDLKAIYATASHELIARRMLEMPPPVIVTLADQGRCVWRRSNGLSRTPPLTTPERAAWTAAHDGGQPAQCEPSELPDGVDDVRAWPIHEPGWRREIIRTELTQW
jgi:hypothetical protein